jgi:hypothetical protein
VGESFGYEKIVQSGGSFFFALRKKFLLVAYLQSRYQTRGVSHYGLAIYIKKYLTEKEELWKFKYFTCKNIIFEKKNPSKRNKNPSRYHNVTTNLKFQHEPKCHLSKIVISK